MMVMLPLHNNANASGTGTASAESGAQLLSTDEVISMLQQQHILQVVKIFTSIIRKFMKEYLKT